MHLTEVKYQEKKLKDKIKTVKEKLFENLW